MANGVPRQAMAASPGWEAISPGDAGFSPSLDRSFAQLQSAGELTNVHGVVAIRCGRIVFERYSPGTDEAWGRPLGHVEFTADTLHDLRSVTKSLVGLLYGIALEAGRVPAPDATLLAQFPEYPDLAGDPQRAALMVAHVLTMTLGLEWDEERPYTDPANSEIMMERAPDRIRFILNRPVLATPGRGWIYCGGATALLGRLIEKGTGQDIESFAQAALFEPLGITQWGWARGRDGVAAAASGCRLTPRDLARIGVMLLAKGRWNGRQIVPAAWLESSLQRRAMVDDVRRYGYHWYMGEWAVQGRGGTTGMRWIGAYGLGGQRLFVLPDLDFVLVVAAGNYNRPDQWRLPMAILREVFLANLA